LIESFSGPAIPWIVVFDFKLTSPFFGTEDAGTKIINAVLLIVANHFSISNFAACGMGTDDKNRSSAVAVG
jgi:hypothetical protein